MEHIKKASQACSFPPWVLNSLHNKFNCKHNIHNGQNSTDNQPNNNNNSGTNNKNNKNISIVVPYIHGLEEKFNRTCNKMEIQVYFKGTNNINTLIMPPGTGQANYKRVESFINLNFQISTAQKNI